MALHRNSGPIFQRDTASPSSTTSASAATTTTSSSGNNQGLSATAVVAFLAVGLFMAAILTIFGWRRIVSGRFLLQPTVADDGFHVPRTAESYGETPRLWDLWTQPFVGSDEQLKWEQIMPFSASIKQSSEDADLHTQLRIPMQSIQQQIRRRTRSAKPTDGHRIDAAQGGQLQVAVAIAMPSPHKRENDLTEEGTSANIHADEHYDAYPLEYSLGLMEMPWYSDEQ